MKAWINLPDGSQVDVGNSCQIGRLPTCAIRIDSADVSRQHAFIHVQLAENGSEYWLADLGSTNGTVLNGRRLTIPTRLQHGDEVIIGDMKLVFQHDEATDQEAETEHITVTQPLRASRHCWLLMVDIKSFTALTLSMPPDVLGHTVGTWLRRTRQVIESAGGIVDKFLGDAVFAYWEAGPDAESKVAAALAELRRMQEERSPEFRVVAHLGPALFAGKAGGANNISGLEVIYVFRVEKIGSGLGIDSVASEAAKNALSPLVSFESVGSHKLDGFSGEHPLYKIVEFGSPKPNDAGKGRGRRRTKSRKG